MDDLLALASEPEASEGEDHLVPEPEKVEGDTKASTDIKANIDNMAHMGSKDATDNKAHMESKAATDNEANAESSSEDDVDMDSIEDDDGGSEDIPRHTDGSAHPSALFSQIVFKFSNQFHSFFGTLLQHGNRTLQHGYSTATARLQHGYSTATALATHSKAHAQHAHRLQQQTLILCFFAVF